MKHFKVLINNKIMTIKQIKGISRPKESPEADPSTLSNYQNFSVKSTNLNFDVDFDSKLMSGDIYMDMICLKEIKEVVLDTSYLNIKQVKINDVPASFVIDDRIEALGSALRIPYEVNEPNTPLSVFITFQTTDQCTALQFLEKEATDGKKFPYLFSQSEPIHSRSFFPCFDTPALKSTYLLSIKSPYNSVMSGLPIETSEKDLYKFEQPVPIPSYLVALASGNIEKLRVGPRSHVYCEPPKLKMCQNEFNGDVENFIKAAEKIVFGYEWKEYDVLILPSAFPYGGMEIPNVTFATPTIVTGDKSNIDVVAHELAHSWAGNLVTNCSWEHFWLNEGWCVYLERRILGEVHGEPTRDFAAIIGWYDLDNAIKAMGETADRFSSLYHNLKDGCDPDDAFSVVPYEKGSTLLYHIENLLSKEKFDPFLPFYFNKFKYQSIDSYQFIDSLYEFFVDDHDILDKVDWETWIFKPGMPPIKPKFDTTLVDQCYHLADRWYDAIFSSLNYDLEFDIADIESLNANQSVVF